jgi:hypothetical protein
MICTCGWLNTNANGLKFKSPIKIIFGVVGCDASICYLNGMMLKSKKGSYFRNQFSEEIL